MMSAYALTFQREPRQQQKKVRWKSSPCQATSGLRTTTTLLSEEQLRAAEAAFQQIENPTLFPKYFEFALANYREPHRERMIADAVRDYIEVKKREEERGLLSLRQFRSISNELKTFAEQFASSVISQMKADVLT
ncbi:hypothetical protein M2447_002676 [Ereboglobus sp. PH5-10]|uniref:hypothetical protein n=1 Tax=Ereboglobus sp. PH5-10 TaxID=2940629 RepID=UPI002404B0EC|nr:hypothetical protein [Ereboglobus sp. PH5-10]MDF9828552.1 hypothetical protein [Ereboglobus sp. PH5-10]